MPTQPARPEPLHESSPGSSRSPAGPAPLPGDPRRAGAWSLAPGLRVVRRGQDLLQVGLLPPRRTVLPRDQHALELLDSLSTGSPVPEAPGSLRLLDRLVERGSVVPTTGARRTRVRLLRCGAVPGWDVVQRLAGLGVDAVPGTGADVLEPDEAPLGTVPDGAPSRRPAVVLVVVGGELDRGVLDPLVREGVPHLLLRLVDGGVTLGPFVDPGRTACLRCLDAETAAGDPEHAAVLERYVRATTAPRLDLADEPEAGLVGLALARAARDLVRHALGRQPVTWSATLRWTPEDDDPPPQVWRRHPRCGCGWLASWGTMEV